MPIRVRYKANDLSEGVVETISEANAFEVQEDNTLRLLERWTDEETEKIRQRCVGVVKWDRWDSVVVLEEADQE